jgi:selenocysteine-specific elongation factor
MIIATAGHVDHGKTSLVRALTGVDTDRLPEEKARGLTIDIGFAYVPLPDGRLLGFVDVPGHQRFIKNMLTGVGNVDHALLVVAADDGVMPQTVEHVEILDLLGVTQATVAITKIDKVEAARSEDVETEIRALLSRTCITAENVFRVSVRTDEGIEPLRARMAALAQAYVARPPAGRFRLAVDRAFILHGVGVVATGSVHAGIARVGETVTVAPAGVTARLRALRIHDRDVSSVQASDRCAMQLSGAALDDLRRGVWVTAGENQATERIEVDLRLLGPERPLRHWAPAHLHIGTEDLTCRVALLSAKAVQPGETALAALHLDRPIAAWAKQKFILRDQSAKRTLGGGLVLDPLPPAHPLPTLPRSPHPSLPGKRGREGWGERGRVGRGLRLTRLDALRAPDAAAAFARMLNASVRGFDLDIFARSWNLTSSECEALLAVGSARICQDGNAKIAVHGEHWKALLDQTVEVLAARHRNRPELLGLDETDVRAALRPPVTNSLLRRAVAELCEAGIVARQGTIIHLSGHQVRPTAAEAALWKRVGPALAADGVRPPRVRELVDRVGIGLVPLESFLARAEQLGWAHQVAKNRYFLPATLDELERVAAQVAAECPDGTFSAADFNRLTGIGRNLTIQVLEYFDRIGITQRDGDRRRPLHAPARTGQP